MVKRVMACICLVLGTMAVGEAAPFLVSDPAPSAVGGSFEIQESGVVVAVQTNQPDGSIRYDLKDIQAGSHSWQIRYVVDNGVWGKAYSVFVPFEFKKPGSAAEPIKGSRLATE